MTITITGAKGYNATSYTGGSDPLIDCTGFTAIVANDVDLPNLNYYPLVIKLWQADFTLQGGEILAGDAVNGWVPLDTETWGSIYYNDGPGSEGNSAAVLVKQAEANAIFDGWRIDGCFDGIRFTSNVAFAQTYTIRNTWISRTRDDAVECDQGGSGLIEDCLFEECYTGISVGSASTTSGAVNETVTIDRVMIGMGDWYHDDRVGQTHASPLKCNTTNCPSLVITDSIIAIKHVDHLDYPRLAAAFGRVHASSSGNYFLNMSDDALPSGYPTIPSSFTVLNGQAARDYWDAARQSYLTPGGEPDPEAPEVEAITVAWISPTQAVTTQCAEAMDVTVTLKATDEGPPPESDTQTMRIIVQEAA